MGVISFFNRGVSLFPDRTCFVEAGRSLTYREADERVRRVGSAILTNGVGGRERVAVLSPNSVAMFEAILGIYKAGAIYVPLNARNHPDENLFILNRAKVTTLFFHSSLGAIIPRLRQECPSIVRTVCLDRSDDASPELGEWLNTGTAAVPTYEPSPDTVTGIHSSGGTTGRPKGVQLTSLVWDTAAANLLTALKNEKPPVNLVVTPITHAAGAVAFCLMAEGATHIVHSHFDAGEVLAAIERHGVTHLWLPPTAIYMLLSHPDLRKHDYSSLEYFMYAASPMSVDKLKTCLDVFGPVMAQSFGQAEAPMYCTWLDREDHAVGDPKLERRLASCGRPMTFTPVEIMDDDGNLLPTGERGEIVARGNLVMAGYLDDPEATAAAIQDGWLRTGDVGFKDEDGYIYIVDRKKQMIITGGLNVYPSEIERVILSHPAIQECAVIGVPDDKWGEAIKAIVKLRPGTDATEAEIVALCKGRLGGVKTPKSVEFWDDIPLTPVGKVDKKAIRAPYWSGQTRAV